MKFFATCLTCCYNATGEGLLLTAEKSAPSRPQNQGTEGLQDDLVCSRLLINCGDGIQRFCTENHFKLFSLSCICITSLAPHNISGFPGVFLALSTLGVGELTVIGPTGIKSYIQLMTPFINRKYPVLNIIEVDAFTEVSELSIDMNYFRIQLQRVEATEVPGRVIALAARVQLLGYDHPQSMTSHTGNKETMVGSVDIVPIAYYFDTSPTLAQLYDNFQSLSSAAATRDKKLQQLIVFTPLAASSVFNKTGALVSADEGGGQFEHVAQLRSFCKEHSIPGLLFPGVLSNQCGEFAFSQSNLTLLHHIFPPLFPNALKGLGLLHQQQCHQQRCLNSSYFNESTNASDNISEYGGQLFLAMPLLAFEFHHSFNTNLTVKQEPCMQMILSNGEEKVQQYNRRIAHQLRYILCEKAASGLRETNLNSAGLPDLTIKRYSSFNDKVQQWLSRSTFASDGAGSRVDLHASKRRHSFNLKLQQPASSMIDDDDWGDAFSPRSDTDIPTDGKLEGSIKVIAGSNLYRQDSNGSAATTCSNFSAAGSLRQQLLRRKKPPVVPPLHGLSSLNNSTQHCTDNSPRTSLNHGQQIRPPVVPPLQGLATLNNLLQGNQQQHTDISPRIPSPYRAHARLNRSDDALQIQSFSPRTVGPAANPSPRGGINSPAYDRPPLPPAPSQTHSKVTSFAKDYVVDVFTGGTAGAMHYMKQRQQRQEPSINTASNDAAYQENENLQPPATGTITSTTVTTLATMTTGYSTPENGFNPISRKRPAANDDIGKKVNSVVARKDTSVNVDSDEETVVTVSMGSPFKSARLSEQHRSVAQYSPRSELSSVRNDAESGAQELSRRRRTFSEDPSIDVSALAEYTADPQQGPSTFDTITTNSSFAAFGADEIIDADREDQETIGTDMQLDDDRIEEQTEFLSPSQIETYLNVPPPNPISDVCSITFLGTGSAAPSKHRNGSSIMIAFTQQQKDLGCAQRSDDASIGLSTLTLNPEANSSESGIGSAENNLNNSSLASRRSFRMKKLSIATEDSSPANLTPDSVNGRNYLLAALPQIMLLDVGESTASQIYQSVGGDLERFDKILMGIRIIWISHHHADHITGLPMLLQQIQRAWMREKERLKATANQTGQKEGIDDCILPCQSTNDATRFRSKSEANISLSSSTLSSLLVSPRINVPKLAQTRSKYDIVKSSLSSGFFEEGKVMIIASEAVLKYAEYAACVAGLEEYVNFYPITKSLYAGMNSDIRAASGGCITRLASIPVYHCHASYGVVITLANGQKIVYSGDCRPSKSLINAGRGCDLLIHEATFDDWRVDDATKKKHSTYSEAVAVGKRMGARATLLTHFSQRYPVLLTSTATGDYTGSQQDYDANYGQRVAARDSKGAVAVAYDFLKFSFPSQAYALSKVSTSIGKIMCALAAERRASNDGPDIEMS